MDYLPLFLDLKQQPVLVVGGGIVAERKIALLQRAGAEVQVIAQILTIELYKRHKQGQMQWIGREFAPEQLQQVILVVAATDDQQLDQKVYEAACRQGLLVNVVDQPQLCSFIFPAIIDRSPLLVAISSAGKAPVLARLLRERLEALLPVSLGTMARIAGEWRQSVRQRFSHLAQRRRFWERAFNGPFAFLVSAGRLNEAEQHLQSMLKEEPPSTGEVTLVGAGPGDAGLLTLRGLQAIQQADVVLYDALVSEEVLDLIRRDAQRIYVGKRAGSHSISQGGINQRLIELAQKGKRVVRLKGGDPMIFARGGEELEALTKAGIPFQVVPGITAAAGAAAYAGIPLTHRDHSQTLILLTGQHQTDRMDWAMLAQPNQTLAIYMGLMKAEELCRQLLQHGRSPYTPVAIISKATRIEQRVITGNLHQLEQLARQADSPALLLIGEVVNLHQQLGWFGEPPSLSLEGANWAGWVNQA